MWLTERLSERADDQEADSAINPTASPGATPDSPPTPIEGTRDERLLTAGEVPVAYQQSRPTVGVRTDEAL